MSDGSPIKIVQETDYPWDGQIKFTIDSPDKNFSIFLRIPHWADDAEIKINGQKTNTDMNYGTYIQLQRNWSSGDTIELILPMKVRLMSADPRVEEARNQVAVMRGPIVYCLEGIDLPDGLDINYVHIPYDIQLNPRYDKDLLCGVTVLDGIAHCIQTRHGDRLYNEIRDSDVKEIPIKLIPYYAWNNRGITEMTVWMPVSWSAT